MPQDSSPQIPHDAAVCFWLREKSYVLSAFDDLKERMASMEKKLDAVSASLADTKAQGRALEGLEEKMSLSREEIATLKVKASLFGVGAAAALEVAFVVVKSLLGK